MAGETGDLLESTGLQGSSVAWSSTFLALHPVMFPLRSVASSMSHTLSFHLLCYTGDLMRKAWSFDSARINHEFFYFISRALTMEERGSWGTDITTNRQAPRVVAILMATSFVASILITILRAMVINGGATFFALKTLKYSLYIACL